jgi:hypothetical protein
MRNKFTIEGAFPNKPADALYELSMYLQVWRPVARRQDREMLELTICKIRVFHSSMRDAI